MLVITRRKRHFGGAIAISKLETICDPNVPVTKRPFPLSGFIPSLVRLLSPVRLLSVVRLLLVGSMLLVPAFSQTLINLGAQARNPDFSNLPVTRPVTVGTAAPATCQLGQLFFNSAAAPGSNLLGCTAVNTWFELGGTASSSTGNATSIQGVAVSSTAPVNSQVLQYQSSSNSYVPASLGGFSGNATSIQGNPVKAGVPSGSQGYFWNAADGMFELMNGPACSQFASQLNDFLPHYSSTSGGTLTVNSGVSSSLPVIVRIPGTNTFYRGTTAVAAYATSGASDTAYAYIDSFGNFVIGTSSAAVTCTGCTATTGVTAFPTNSVALFTWAISSASFTAGGYTDYRSFIQ